jgi:hypothetical protein
LSPTSAASHAHAPVSDFASALAGHLPGTWRSTQESFATFEDQFPRADQIWAYGSPGSALLDWHLEHAARLDGLAGQQLYVMPRPRYPHQFLVAPLKPEGVKPHHFRGVDEPHGIAVGDDPLRAAAAVARRVLPHYRRALDAVRDNARRQPDPPHRPAAPEVTEQLTLVWYPDGVVGAPYAKVPAPARTVLYGCYFQYSPHEAAFVLPASYGTAARALLLQRAVRLLTAQGIASTSATRPPPQLLRPARRWPCSARNRP